MGLLSEETVYFPCLLPRLEGGEGGGAGDDAAFRRGSRGPSAEDPWGERARGIDWVEIYIGKQKRKNRRQSRNILDIAPTEAY